MYASIYTKSVTINYYFSGGKEVYTNYYGQTFFCIQVYILLWVAFTDLLSVIIIDSEYILKLYILFYF